MSPEFADLYIHMHLLSAILLDPDESWTKDHTIEMFSITWTRGGCDYNCLMWAFAHQLNLTLICGIKES